MRLSTSFLHIVPLLKSEEIPFYSVAVYFTVSLKKIGRCLGFPLIL